MKKLPFLLAFALAALALGQTLVRPQEDARRIAILFLGAPTANGPGHDPITRYRTIKKHLGAEGIDFTYSDNPHVAFRSETLAQFDAVLLYGNWEQNGKLPKPQKKALFDFIETGGGFLPIHCASACYGDSPEFVELVGAKFQSHKSAVFRPKTVKSDHPITTGYQGFEAWDETYLHSHHNDDRTILQKRGDEPWTWVRNHGEGRVFYTASGHDHRVWDQANFHDLLKRAIYWTVGNEAKGRLDNLKLPVFEFEEAILPGYKERRTITQYQLPLPPEKSLKLAQVPPGFELSLFASEPDIINPIAIAWDDHGSAYVVETIDYPNNLQAENRGNDRIKICQDTDGDHRADKFTVFADKLSVPTSLCFAFGGVLCTNGDELLFLKDTDGDQQADVRKVLFRGFNTHDTHAGVSNLRAAPDGWVYATIGYAGFKGTVGDQEIEFRTGIFRFRANSDTLTTEVGKDGTLQSIISLEFLQQTTNNTWGLGFTSDFRIMASTANGNPSMWHTFPKRYYDQAHLPQPRTPRADDNPLFFPSSRDIRQVDQQERYTAAAGHAIYTANRFPAEYHDKMAFVCGPTGKLVGQFALERKGSGFSSTQLPNNLYNSADAWSSPVAAEVGPDGAVWICDWYNIIIQHNPTPSLKSAGYDASRGKGNAYSTPLRDKEHGRIYRVYPKESKDEKPMISPELNSGWNLMALLGTPPSPFWDEHYLQAFANGKNFAETSAATRENDLKILKDAVGSTNFPQRRLFAFRLLQRLGKLDLATITTALQADDPGLRRAALALAPLDQTLETLFLEEGQINEQDPATQIELMLAFSRLAPSDTIASALSQFTFDPEDIGLANAHQVAIRSHAIPILRIAALSTDNPIEHAKEVNLITNSTFNTDQGWVPTRYGPREPSTLFTHSATEGRNGSGCLVIQSRKPADAGWRYSIPVKPNTEYRIGGYIRTTGLQTLSGKGALFNIHGSSQTQALHKRTEWQEISVNFTTKPNQTEAFFHCLFGGYGTATGTAYYDDVYCYEVAPSSGGSSLPELARYLVKSSTPTILTTFLTELDSLKTPNAPKIAQLIRSIPTTEETMIRKFKPNPKVHMRGAELYANTCIACHGPEGQGVAEVFPPLDGADWVTGSPAIPIKILLHGLQGPIKVKGKSYNNIMPPHDAFTDRQVADVLTFVRQSWSNDAPAVPAATVKTIRAQTASRKALWTAKELAP